MKIFFSSFWVYNSFNSMQKTNKNDHIVLKMSSNYNTYIISKKLCLIIYLNPCTVSFLAIKLSSKTFLWQWIFLTFSNSLKGKCSYRGNNGIRHNFLMISLILIIANDMNVCKKILLVWHILKISEKLNIFVLNDVI